VATAQTTIVLNAPNTQVVDTTLRNGPYATYNHDSGILYTRYSTVPDWERRSILGFETAAVPSGSVISSAVLTVTLKSGLGTAGSTRPVTAYRIASPFVENQATWINRQTGVPWPTAGGDITESYITVDVTNTAGAKVSFDVTDLVQRTVDGDFATTQARIALVDVGGGGDAKESYREYYSSEASSSSNRPKLTITYASTTPGVFDVPPGGDLQTALNVVPRGGTIRLTPGVTYTGNFTLPAKPGEDYITITTGAVTLPPEGARIDPSYRTSLASLKSPTGSPVLSTAPGASYYRIVGVSFEPNLRGSGDVIALGSHSQTDINTVPHHIELDRILLAGDAATGQKRGISVNATHVTVMNSDIRDIKAVGMDSQAIAGWNTPGPITIRNNFLEAAGENILFGGAGITLPGNVIPSDILIEGNHLTKDLQWKGSSWTIKNLLELKNARRVVVRDNTIEHNWKAAQQGYAIVLTPRNTNGKSPWVVVEDVHFIGNVIRHSSGAFNILGHDDTAISGQLSGLVIKDNLVYDISSSYGGSGIFAQIGGEPRDITIDHNTILHTGNIITFYLGVYINGSGTKVTAGPIEEFVFTNNFVKHNSYGLFGSGQAYGNGSLNYYTPGAVVRRNVMAGGSASRYPADNFFPPSSSFLPSFVNPAADDYRLVSGSPYIAAGTDGLDIGCTIAEVFTRAMQF
jgi:hypothetical protein